MSTGKSIFSGLVVILFVVVSLPIVSADTLIVSPESGAGNYTSIQTALENVRSGDTIMVYPGNYIENVVVNLPDISINSASGRPEDTVVQALNTSESVFCVFANDCKISGFTIQGSERAGIELDSSDCHVISNNIIFANPTGILLSYSNGNTINHNTFEENLEGITMLDSAASTVADNLFNSNVFAIALISSEDNYFSRNTLEDNPSGFELQESENNNIVGNNISESQTSFNLNLSDSNTFSRNELTNNTVVLMMDGSNNNVISENNENTSEIAVMMNSSSDNLFSGNGFTNNSLGFMLEQSENNEISGNTVVNSYIAVFENSSRVNRFSENVFANNLAGFYLQESGENELADNLLDSSIFGVFQDTGDNNVFSGNTLTNIVNGFELQDSDNNELIGNTVNNSEISLSIDSGRDNKVSENRFSTTLIGTVFSGTNNTNISQNEFSNNIIGVMGMEAEINTISNNHFSGNFSEITPLNSLDSLATNYFNKGASLKASNFFTKSGSSGANALLQKEIPKVNGLLKQNQILKEKVSSVENSALREKELFKANESSEDELSNGSELENNSSLSVLEYPFDENITIGMFLSGIDNSILEGNRISGKYYGAVLAGAQNSRFSENWLENNNFGLSLDESNETLVCDNYFNNSNNTDFIAEDLFGLGLAGNESNNESNTTCTWSMNKTKHVNIVGGPFVGGNYWALPNKTGFSQTQKDANKDGICDLPYYITEDGLNTDLLPLADAPSNCGDKYQSGNQGDSSQNSQSGSSSDNSFSGGSSGSSSQKYTSASSNSIEGTDLLNKKIHAGAETKVKLDNPKNDVSEIDFTSKKYSGTVEIRVEAAYLDKIGITGEPDGKAYRYVKILVGNEAFESSENIEGGCIEFRVPKSWVKENEIVSGTINMYRLENSSWKQLETELSGEDGSFYYFRAKTPGFSYFSIAGKQQASIMPQEQKVENPVKSSGSEAATGKADTGDNKKAPGLGIILSGTFVLLSWAYLKRR